MKIGLFGNTYKSNKKTEEQIIPICETIKDKCDKLFISSDFLQTLNISKQKEIENICKVFDKVPKLDIALSIGGDGSFLKTARKIMYKNIPILGVNTGNLGFLADINSNNLKNKLDDIINKNYKIEERILLNVNLDSNNIIKNNSALNEIAILKKNTTSILTINTYIDDEYLGSYQSDGLIIATPTGSTAYSLSVGGPIIVPTSSSIILSAIAPHSLNTRPLIINDTSKIKLVVESRSKKYQISIDGQFFNVDQKIAVNIEKSKQTIKIIKGVQDSFFDTLRDKLMWGKDLRLENS